LIRKQHQIVSFDSENPYASGDVEQFVDPDRQLLIEGVRETGMTGHVLTIGILMIVQGALELFMGCALVGYAVFMPQVLQQMQNQPGAPDMPAEMKQMFPVIVGVMAVLMFLIGLMTTIAGIQVMRFRWRVFGILSLVGGLGSLISCYCLPTALALAVYGLIVLFNEPVKMAFGFGSEGYPAQQIRQAFARLPYDSELFSQMQDQQLE
jgi:hypothetical protein